MLAISIKSALCASALVVVFRRVPTFIPPTNLTPADAIDDLWTLVRVPLTKASGFLPHALAAWVKRFNSDWLFARVHWLDPRQNPWRFACALGLLVGMGLVLAQWQEGLPPAYKPACWRREFYLG